MYLLLEHGGPKSARFFAEAAHMGGEQAMPLIVGWLTQNLARS